MGRRKPLPSRITHQNDKIVLAGPGVKLNPVPDADAKTLGLRTVVGPVGEPPGTGETILMFKTEKDAATFFLRTFHCDKPDALTFIEELDGHDASWEGDVMNGYAAALSAIDTVNHRARRGAKKTP